MSVAPACTWNLQYRHGRGTFRVHMRCIKPLGLDTVSLSYFLRVVSAMHGPRDTRPISAPWNFTRPLTVMMTPVSRLHGAGQIRRSPPPCTSASPSPSPLKIAAYTPASGSISARHFPSAAWIQTVAHTATVYSLFATLCRSILEATAKIAIAIATVRDAVDC